ncbi:acetamidase/formamidase family protein [Ancylobacter sonchi]|uniref:acetamidase/formamidase family protein n=1 Tax=Ancylobacter sonchi TaxID=1937790 RepID=UPI001BD5A5BB|nr:acetamidase/formamidase family protein [Ancylobacter sonchi]MBS7534286.1 acetamidase/formamidase family protein [Ancylobacter sonchi]
MHVSLATIPLAAQRGKWAEALAHLGLQEAGGIDTPVSATVDVQTAPSGSLFARIRSGPMELAYRPAVATRASAYVTFERTSPDALGQGGALHVADGALPWSLGFDGDVDLLVLRVRRDLLFGSLGSGASPSPLRLAGGALGHSARQLLDTIHNRFDALEPTELAPLETALVGLLSSLVRLDRRLDEGGATQVQFAHYQRVAAAVEARLSQPGLAMRDVAASEGMSQRYLQKLFELHHTTFSDFVRTRRLEKARLALLAQDQKSTSIAQIAFQCGFSDQGHFSRLFRAAFGVTPRACRGMTQEPTTTRPYNRGRPAGSNHTALPMEPDAPRALFHQDASVLDGEPLRVRANADTVHWGFLSRDILPVLRVRSGSEVVIETLTQHASDDYERMIRGDVGAESVFHWTAEGKNVERRGAGPLDASLLGRGAGEGFGVHILTGPIFIEEAEPGDILEVQVLDIAPRPSANPQFEGRSFASNASTWWGYQYSDYLDSADLREVVTIFEVEPEGDTARAVYSFRWTPQTDPYGIRHATIDYPGVPVDHATITKIFDPMPNIRVPLFPHFGCMAVAPKERVLVDSIPPGNFGGNLDNWRAGKGATLYLPVLVPGALFSVGDGHLALGDGEMNGTALECSLNGTFRFVLHKKGETASKPFLAGLNCPLLETPAEFVIHGFSYPDYLRDLGQDAQAEVYKRSSLDRALRSAFRVTRKFLMDAWKLEEDAAITFISTAVDFGITQVADGNWGIHAVIPKAAFVQERFAGSDWK